MTTKRFSIAFFLTTTGLQGCAHRLAQQPQAEKPVNAKPAPAEEDDEQVPQGPSEIELKRAASGIVGCRPDEIVIQEANYAEFHEVWVLSCRSGQWICSRQDMPMQEYLHCAIMATGGQPGPVSKSLPKASDAF